MAQQWSASITANTSDWEPNTDIRPSRLVPVLLEGMERPRRIGLMTWGWIRDFASSGKLINARAENLFQKPTFAEAGRSRRCLVPATAWFEWQKTEGSKRGAKHLLRPVGLNVWAIAGIWEVQHVVLLTVAAHPSVAAIHDRMPVIIGPDQAKQWLTAPAEAAWTVVAAVEATAKSV